MGPVGELDQHHPDITAHGQDHFTEILGLALFAGGEMDLADLGHPIDQTGHLGAKLLLDLFQGGQGILDRVVQQAGDDRRHVQLHRGQELGDLNRMDEVGLPGAAFLALMHAF